MTSKISTETVSPNKAIGDSLNYSFGYEYDPDFAHRLISAGNRYYKYDANGNIICEQDGSFESNGEEVSYHKITQEADGVYSTDYGWGLFKEDDKGGSGKAGSNKYKRVYKWNERNQLVSSVDDNYSTAYIYGQDGQRSNKYTQNSETLYFNKMWTLHTDSGNNVYGGQSAKNIYLGETRIVTKLNSGTNPTYQEEYYKQYFYHSDHLGSASLISDYKGDEYQRIEYTPYGETWVEKTSNTGLEWLPYKFTAKELDEETGLYYYGARYLDPKYSMWISTDPALGDYLGQSSKGEGGIYNSTNLNLYHYGNNNPVSYKDPDGEIVINAAAALVGALSGAAIGAVTTAVAGGSGRDIAAAALGGAASGALAGVTLGGSLVAQAAGAAAIGAASGAIGDVVTNAVSGNEITAKGVGKAALGGAVGGLVGFGAGKALSAIGNKVQAVNAVKNASPQKTAEGFDTWLNKGEANNKVYFGMKGDEAKYTGITKQSTSARLNQHNANGKGFTDLRVKESGLTRNQARAIEQYYIENGPNELNKINSISPDNKYYKDAMNWAKNYLGE